MFVKFQQVVQKVTLPLLRIPELILMGLHQNHFQVLSIIMMKLMVMVH
ncbi:hypothetical protein [Liquorilactobacillus satsumensis]|nr:hypothetical protein [Liquorilactobacillus satsumensis]